MSSEFPLSQGEFRFEILEVYRILPFIPLKSKGALRSL